MHTSIFILTTAVAVGLGSVSGAAQSKDLRDVELRRLFQPTSAELRQEQSSRVYIYDGLKEADIDRAMQEQFQRVDSMMLIRVKPASAPRSPSPFVRYAKGKSTYSEGRPCFA